MIVSVKVWKSDVCLDRNPLEYVLPLLIYPKELLMIVSVDWYAINWDHGLINCGTNILHSCWLFGQNKIQFFCLRATMNIVGNTIRGEMWHLAISCDCSALNWNCGPVDCGANVLCGCWLFCQNEIQVYCCNLFNIFVGSRNRGEVWCCFIWSHLILSVAKQWQLWRLRN